MKKIFLILITAATFNFVAVACSNASNTSEPETEAAENAETPAAENAAENEAETIDSVNAK